MSEAPAPIHVQGEGEDALLQEGGGQLPQPPLCSSADDREETSALLGQGLASWGHRDGSILFQVAHGFLLTERGPDIKLA